MSASLVGSEMCIRDRSCVGGAPGGAQDVQHLWAHVQVRRARAQRGYDAVSYTHLTLPTICSV
eukprot:14360872-Alexandrium_andersonii.AAC.1